MGVVKRQSIKQSIVTYFSVAIGMMNILFIYPLCLSEAQFGVIKFFQEYALMLSLLVMIGSGGLIVRYFPIFKNEDNHHNGFLFFILSILGIGCLLLLLLYFLFFDDVNDFFSAKDNPMYLEFMPFLLPFTILWALINVLTIYASNFHRIVIPTLFYDLLPKVGIALIVLAFFFQYLSLYQVFWGIGCVYALGVIGLFWYLYSLGELNLRPNFSFLKKPLLKEMGIYSLYGFLGSLGTRLSSGVLSILLVGVISNLQSTGVYGIAFLIANVIDVPRRAISRITGPLLADKWEAGKLDEIQELYQKSSLNQFIIGTWALLAVWVSIDELFQIMPNGENFVAGKYVILILGLGKVLDMVTGVNSEIIANSKYFKYNFYLVLFLGIVNIATNLVLIPKYNILGAAYATIISVALYNFMKFLVVKWKMGIQPFTRQTISALLIGIATYLIVSFLPKLNITLIDIVIRTGLCTLLFGSLALFFRISPDINSLTLDFLRKIKLK